MLDPRGREEVMEIVSDLNRRLGITVVLITHHMDEAARAQRVVVLDHGEIAADGPPRSVFSQVELLHRLGLSAPETVELCWRLRELGRKCPWIHSLWKNARRHFAAGRRPDPREE